MYMYVSSYLDHIQILQGRYNVFRSNRRLGGHIVNGQIGLAIVFGK
jgi:hypothetical protein